MKMKHLLALLAYAFCPCPASFGYTVFSDDFAGAAANTNYWHIPTWLSDGDGTFLGQTQLRCVPAALPAVGNSNMSITAQSHNPTGNSIYGTDLISNAPFHVGGGLTITVKLKVDAVKKGTVFAFFLYAPPANAASTAHDEIDFEFVGNQPNHFNTNLYGNEPLGVGNPQFIPYNAGSSITDYHTYEIRWLPNQVSWSVDGIPVRTVTNESPIPQGPMYIHFNAWVPDATWPDAYSPDISSVESQAENQIWSMSVGSVSVQSDEAQRLTTLEIDPTTAMLGVGAKQSFEASAIDQNNNSIVTPMKLTWNSDHPAIAKIDASGTMTALKAGTTNITASVGAVKSAPAAITVSPVSVTINRIPKPGATGSAVGVVKGLGAAEYKTHNIAVYINVYGGWWTKPTFDSPLTPIGGKGAWSAYITTGGLDSEATEVRAYLVPASFTVPVCAGGNLPDALSAFPYASMLRTAGTPATSVSPVLKSMQMTPHHLSFVAGGTPQQIIGGPLDHKGNPVSAGIAWFSSNPKVAVVDSTGRVTPMAPGKATIRANVIVNPKIKNTVTVTVAVAKSS